MTQNLPSSLLEALVGVTVPDAEEETAGINNAPAGINNAQNKYSAEINPRVPMSDLISAEQDFHAGYEMSFLA